MNKLELKNLAPYLPYEIEVMAGSRRGYCLVAQINTTEHEREVTIAALCGVSKDYYKPILRPLSDLTKEIEHNGERFVPLNKLKEVDGEYLIGTGEDGALWFEDSCDLGIYEVTRCNALIQKLLEWHFDTQGLIDQGLAVDKNTLKGNK